MSDWGEPLSQPRCERPGLRARERPPANNAGFYEPVRHGINRIVGYAPEAGVAWTALLAGATTGCIGAALGSPLFLIKARMQAYSPVLPVGAQHYYRNSWDALSTIVRNNGVKGLYQGVSAAILRTVCVSQDPV